MKIENGKNPGGCLGMVGLIIYGIYSLFSGINNYIHSDERKAELDKFISDELNKEKEYFSKFDFNTERFNDLIKKTNFKHKKIKTPETPIIIYEINKDKINFPYDLNNYFKNDLSTFNLSKLKTIVVLKDSIVNVGSYSHTNKPAFRTIKIISYINIKTEKEIYYDILQGKDPQEERNYKQEEINSNDSIISYMPQFSEELVQKIRKNLKK